MERWWWWCFSENVYEIEVLWTWWSMNVGYDCKKCNIAILVGALPLKIKWKGSMGWWGGGGGFPYLILGNHILFHDYGLYSVGAGPLMDDGWPTTREMKVKFPCCPTTYFFNGMALGYLYTTSGMWFVDWMVYWCMTGISV